MAPLLYGGIQTLISCHQCQHLKLPLPSSLQHLKLPLLSCFRHWTLMGSSSGVFRISLAKKSFKASWNSGSMSVMTWLALIVRCGLGQALAPWTNQGFWQPVIQAMLDCPIQLIHSRNLCEWLLQPSFNIFTSVLPFFPAFIYSVLPHDHPFFTILLIPHILKCTYSYNDLVGFHTNLLLQIFLDCNTPLVTLVWNCVPIYISGRLCYIYPQSQNYPSAFSGVKAAKHTSMRSCSG